MYRGWTQTDYQNKHYNTNQNGYKMYRGWTQTDYQNKHYNINKKWLQRVQRMDTNRLPKQALQYKPEGRRNVGRPRKRRRDQLYPEDQGTGNRPIPSGT